MIKGPKTILAEAIANALADYFVIDQKSMETKLLSDAGIKLHATQLKPQNGILVTPTTRASIRGLVQYVAFQWHWGKSQKEGGSDWVKDARLIISGLRFTVTLTPADSPQDILATSSNHNLVKEEEPNVKTDPTGIMAYVQDQVQRILDTLTIVIDNILFTIVLPDGSNVQFGGSALEISSLETVIPTPTEQQTKILLQKLQVQRLYSFVTSRDGDTFPLLGDLFYEARIQRSVGNRFVSGFEHGLQVEGNSDDNGVIIHTGSIQLEVLNILLGILVAVPGSHTYPSASGNYNIIDKKPEFSSSVRTKATIADEKPSFIGLKLSSVSLVLPNEVKLSLNDLILKYRFDGTMLQVEGKAGCTVDGFPVLALGETSAWSLDLLHGIFCIQDTALNKNIAENDEMIIFLNARQEEIRKVSDGLNEALGIFQELDSMENGAIATLASYPKELVNEPDNNNNSDSSSWTLELIGKLGCMIEQQNDSEIVFTLRNIKADCDKMVVEIDSLDECRIPGILHLVEPIVQTKIKFEDSSLLVIIQEVVAVLAEVDEEQNRIDKTEGKNLTSNSSSSTDENKCIDSNEKCDKIEPTSVSLPFAVRLDLKKFIAFKPDGKSVHTTVEGLDFRIAHITSKHNSSLVNTAVVVTMDEVNHDMLRLVQPSLRFGVDQSSSSDTIYDLNFGANEIRIAAGYSIGDWKSLIPKTKQARFQAKSTKLPNAHIDKLTVVVHVKGLIGFNDSILRVPQFHGKQNTCMDDVIQFYNERVITQVPGMIVNSQVLGTNVSDGLVSHFGGGFLATTIGSAGIGGLVSVAAFDGVKNTIKAGKVSRGVAESDKWQLSDLVSGLRHTALCATRKGAAKRGKNVGDKADVIDWAVGATTDVAMYSNENKARLGGAGAGAAGFAFGFALGGPVGAVAGTIIASATTQKTIEKVENAFKKGNAMQQLQATQEMIKDINPIENNDGVILHQGFLFKRCDFVIWDWKPHCFVLAEGELKYYDLSTHCPSRGKNNEGVLFMDSSKGPHKTLKFDNHRVAISDNLSSPAANLFVFTIHDLDQREPLWVLAAPTVELRSVWVSKLHCQMSRYSSKMYVDADYSPVQPSTSRKKLVASDTD